MFGCSIAFIRMRSPSSAPPVLRRDGSIEISAIRRRSCWSSRKRRTISSVSELLPAPPVPVIPSVGVRAFAAAVSRTPCVFSGIVPASSAVIIRASERVRAWWPPVTSAVASAGTSCPRSMSQAATISPIIPSRPSRCPSSGEKMRATP